MRRAVLAIVLLAALATALPFRRTVEPEVFEAMQKNGGKVDVYVQLPLFRWNNEELEKLPRGERLWHVYKTLQAHCEHLGTPVRHFAQGLNLQVRPFWIASVLKVSDATPEFVQRISQLPMVEAVHLERQLPVPEPIDMQVATATNGTIAVEWGLDKIQVPSVWSLGYKGQGIVVANVDTGVRGTHEALRSNYRGAQTGSDDYNWYDKTRQATASPSDGNGHGTHTIGTIAGSEASGVGVAPASVWIAGKGCGSVSCSTADLLGSGEFLACPTRADGRNPDCTKAPHVINNSWGGGQGDTWYQGVITSWLAAGIIPVFSAGNSGPSCSTANSPADNNNVISVAASDATDTLASFSSRGPAVAGSGIGRQKPEITAPGVAVRSTWNTGDSAYNSISGTSMAGPHVAGVVALMLNANPNLTYNQVYNIIISNADTATLKQPSGASSCGGVAWNSFPNFHYGYGRINALKAVQASLALKQ